MTTLAENASASDREIVVDSDAALDPGQRFRLDDEILTFFGYDRDSVVDALLVRRSERRPWTGERTRWAVERGQDGTTAASHLSGATLYAVADARVTGTDLTPPLPFAGAPEDVAPIPTLAEVLAEGNDPGTDTNPAMAAATDGGRVGANLTLVASQAAGVGGAATLTADDGAAANAGGDAQLAAGWGDGGTVDSAAVAVQGGQGDGTKGKASVYTDGTTGSPGDSLTSDGTYATWGRPYIPIDLSATAATEAQFSDVLDTRGGKSLGLVLRILDTSTPATDYLQVTVLTRITGLAWMICPILEFDSTEPMLVGFGMQARVATGGGTLPSETAIAVWGLLDESIIAVGPLGTDNTWTAAVDETNGVTWFAGISGSVVGLFGVELVDPGANDSLLSITSVDGYRFTVNLATDSNGDITTTLDDLGMLFQSTYPYAIFPASGAAGLAVLQPTALLDFAPASDGTVTMNYSVQGTV
jgi:hypothetical protein